MFSILWGNIQHGQLARLPYLGFSLLIGLVLILLGLSVMMLGNGIEQAADLESGISLTLSLPEFTLLLVVAAVMGFAGVNLMAKRLRHIGLPGWPTTLALTLLVAAVGIGWSLFGAIGFQFLIWLTLLCLPKGTFSHSYNSSVH